MDRAGLLVWVSMYERAWRAPGTDLLDQLFAREASYRTAPFEQPYRGLSAIAAMWEAGRDGPDEVFTMSSEIVAVEDDTGVVRVEVQYGDPVQQTYLDLWVVRFAQGGRCLAFEEWPFWPRGARGGYHAGPNQSAEEPDAPST